MLTGLILFAQKNAENGADPGWTALLDFLPMVLIFGLLIWFMMIMPARQQKRERQNLLASLKKNDKVMTAGGIIGVITYINDQEDEVTIRVEEGKLRVLKTSIARNFGEEEKKQQATGIKKA